MRAKNREINIFNISLLDVLTGMLGAFLFLMLGLVPYYSKQISGVTITEEEKRKFDELKKLLEKGLKGPLTPEEVAQLQAELNRLQSENQQLQALNNQLQTQNNQLQNELNQTQQDLQAMTEDRDKWKDRVQIELIVSADWDSERADVDIYILAPTGKIYGSKSPELPGKTFVPMGTDSHKPGRPGTNNEQVIIDIAPGENYLILYHIQPGAAPTDYANLRCWLTVINSIDNNYIGFPIPGLIPSDVTPRKLYAWVVVNYDGKSLTTHAPKQGEVPPGVSIP